MKSRLILGGLALMAYPFVALPSLAAKIALVPLCHLVVVVALFLAWFAVGA